MAKDKTLFPHHSGKKTKTKTRNSLLALAFNIVWEITANSVRRERSSGERERGRKERTKKRNRKKQRKRKEGRQTGR